jgi:hypothetical protein
MTDIEFTSPGVEKLLQNLNPNKAAGPDFLPTRMLKMVAKEIAPVLAFIFQQSYDTSQVPSDWQLANVTAVFKKGDKTNPANYRPVSLTCILCKTMEHIVFIQIMNHLDHKKILRNFQHRFRRNHSCETQLLNTAEELSRRLDMRQTNARHFGTRTFRYLCETFRYQDKSAPQKDNSALVFFSLILRTKLPNFNHVCSGKDPYSVLPPMTTITLECFLPRADNTVTLYTTVV